MQRKIFIGISLPDDVKKRLNQKIEKWRELPIKWSKEGNFHITLSFLGFIKDDTLADICSGVKEVAENFENFDIEFEKIELGPDAKNPRLVWFSGNASEELKKLQSDIEKALDIFVREKKIFKPHITLGRISKLKWETLPEVPKIEENFRVSIPIERVEVFESRMEDGKKVYDILESCMLK
ncbi:MAG: RNA 2',3'-cyclic phosphodiesterase [bacterium]|nr:RNA 2',3'-cyclic phosphodiesterase [bacterium]